MITRIIKKEFVGSIGKIRIGVHLSYSFVF